VLKSKGRGVLVTPHARGMAALREARATNLLSASSTQIGFPVYGIEAVKPPSTGIAWPFT
jgi:hypothetical protein